MLLLSLPELFSAEESTKYIMSHQRFILSRSHHPLCSETAAEHIVCWLRIKMLGSGK
jgi:hypothetical protein